MTANVKEALEKIQSCDIFEKHPLYFVGGTALAYHLGHRVSEDIDIVSNALLPHKEIVSAISKIGGIKLRDEHASSLRIAGLFPDEYMLKFNLDGVKVEFFKASTAIQNSIISTAVITKYHDSALSLLDVESIAKLKLVALLSRKKSRDLFDFQTVLQKNILTPKEIVETASGSTKAICHLEDLYQFILQAEQPLDDEVVYLDELKPTVLSWDEIKEETLLRLSHLMDKADKYA